MSFAVLPKSLGLCLALVEDPNAFEQVKGRYAPRLRRNTRYGNEARPLGTRIIDRVRAQVLKEFFSKAGKAAQKARTPEERSTLGRKAALARWSSVRRKMAGRK
jgi:hypothetical protein